MFFICFKARLMIMRDDIRDLLNCELRKLNEATYACNVYTIAIKSDNDYIDLDLVKVEDYNEVVKLYNSLIKDLNEEDLTNNYRDAIRYMNKRFFKYY